MNTYYIAGDRNAICQRCGRKRKMSQIAREWNGLYVCKDTCWEERHPQDFPGTPTDKPPYSISLPEPPDKFV